MINELIEQAKKIYGNRKTLENNCAFCGGFIGNAYCTCIESFKINRIARRINEKAQTLERIKLLNINFDLTETSNIPLKYASITLEQYKIRNIKEKSVFDQIKKYQDNLISNYLTGKNLMLIGNYGTAKSFLLSALCNYCTKEKNLKAKYINVVDLANEVKSTFNDGTPKTTEDVINEYVGLDVLFIDDLDKEQPTEYIKKLIYNIVNRRYEDMRPTVISSNSNLEALDVKFYGEATISRLHENAEIIYFESENERLIA